MEGGKIDRIRSRKIMGRKKDRQDNFNIDLASELGKDEHWKEERYKDKIKKDHGNEER